MKKTLLFAFLAVPLGLFAQETTSTCFVEDTRVCAAEDFLKGIGIRFAHQSPYPGHPKPGFVSQAEVKAMLLAHSFDPWTCTFGSRPTYKFTLCKTQRKTTKLELKFDISEDKLLEVVLTMKPWNGDSVYCGGAIDDANCWVQTP